MKPYLLYARHYWQQLVRPGDSVIDATIGNGQDTFFLAQLLKGHGSLVGYDVQPLAIEQTKKRLQELPEAFNRIISLKLQSHAHFEEKNIKLIVYNLGYLPGGNKTLTTQCTTTLESIQNGLAALTVNGALSITCYPHEEGAKEQKAIVDFINTLPQEKWLIRHHLWIRGNSLSPSLIWLQSLLPKRRIDLFRDS